MEISKIILTAVFSIVELFILTKLMGKRQISELNFFDYVCGITIGSIAGEMTTHSLEEALAPAVSMAVYAIVAIIIAFLCDKSLKLREFFESKPITLLDNGKIIENNLKKARIDINELLMQTRINGYFNIDDLQTVILESNGSMSFLPKSESRPLNPEDINLHPLEEKVFVPLIIDGKVLDDNLKKCGKDIVWLKNELKEKNNGKIAKTLLAAWNNATFICFKKDSQ